MKTLRVLTLPVIMVVSSLSASAYVLGLMFDSTPPLFQIFLDRTCAQVPKKMARYRPELDGIDQPVSKVPWGLYIPVENYIGPPQCSGIKLAFGRVPWGVSASVDSGKTDSSGGAQVKDIDLWPLRDKGYPNIVEYYAPESEHLGRLLLSGPSPAKIGFATKGIVLNLNVDVQQEGDLHIEVVLPEGYVLDPGTTPAPQHIDSSKSGAPNVYQFVLSRGEFSLPGYLTASLRLVYYSEWKKMLQDNLLFVLAAIFGCAVQLLIDAAKTLRALSTRNLDAP